jgi:hypothetical protein
VIGTRGEITDHFTAIANLGPVARARLQRGGASPGIGRRQWQAAALLAS